MRRPFLVLPNHMCVPLEGPYRLEEHQGQWWVLGNHDAVACNSEQIARLTLSRVNLEHDAHALMADALSDVSDDIGSDDLEASFISD